MLGVPTPAQDVLAVGKVVRNVDPATYEASWKPSLEAGYADLAKDGVKAVKFTSAEEKKFKSTVLEAAWAAVKAKDSVNGPALQEMLME